jgi:hypothetical protein
MFTCLSEVHNQITQKDTAESQCNNGLWPKVTGTNLEVDAPSR